MTNKLMTNKFTTFVNHLIDLTNTGEIKWDAPDQLSFECHLNIIPSTVATSTSDIDIKIAYTGGTSKKYVLHIQKGLTSIGIYAAPSGGYMNTLIKTLFETVYSISINDKLSPIIECLELGDLTNLSELTKEKSLVPTESIWLDHKETDTFIEIDKDRKLKYYDKKTGKYRTVTSPLGLGCENKEISQNQIADEYINIGWKIIEKPKNIRP